MDNPEDHIAVLPHPKIVPYHETPNYKTDYLVAKINNGYEDVKPNWSWYGFLKGPMLIEYRMRYSMLFFAYLLFLKILAIFTESYLLIPGIIAAWLVSSLYYGLRFNALRLEKYMQEYDFVVVRSNSSFEAREIARKELNRRTASAKDNPIQFGFKQ